MTSNSSWSLASLRSPLRWRLNPGSCNTTITMVGQEGQLLHAENQRGAFWGEPKHHLSTHLPSGFVGKTHCIAASPSSHSRDCKNRAGIALLARASNETQRISWELPLFPGNGRGTLYLPAIGPGCHISTVPRWNILSERDGLSNVYVIECY